MSWKNDPDVWGVIAALLISLTSGFISISRRILEGHTASFLWIISEFCTAILCGYIMFDAYPKLATSLPDWVTMPLAVAVAAHIGGRVFQEVEKAFLKRYALLLKLKRHDLEH